MGILPASHPRLKKLLEEVLEKMPEAKQYDFLIVFAQIKYLGTINQLRGVYYIQVTNRAMQWNDAAIRAIISHEVAHIFEKGEYAVTLYTLRRGFFEDNRELFKYLCKKPCWKYIYENNTVKIVFTRQYYSGGIRCRDRQGRPLAFCPFYNTHIAEIVPYYGRFICGLDNQMHNGAGYMCTSCGTKFHKECIMAYVELNGVCPICKKFAVIKTKKR